MDFLIWIVSTFAWLILAWLVGMWGKRKGHSFWLGFLVSLIFSVIIGAILVLVLKDKRTGRRGF
jgi:hypothetical protein